MGLTSESKFSQALNPALRKLALLMHLDPTATLADLTDAMRRLPKCDIHEAKQRLRAYDVACVAEALEREKRLGAAKHTNENSKGRLTDGRTACVGDD